MDGQQARWLWNSALPAREALRGAISAQYLADENQMLQRLLPLARLEAPQAQRVAAQAADWVRQLRAQRERGSALDAFMRQYDLSSEAGVMLMCLAEALLRIPDDDTAEKLIADKLGGASWEQHLGRSDSLFVNASTWGLMLTGRIVRLAPEDTGSLRQVFARLLGSSTEPVIRLAMRQAMRLMGSQFVMGRDIAEALRNAAARERPLERYSFDMLGEAALTGADAQRYFEAYVQAIQAIGAQARDAAQALHARPGISVKLSALHPRYEFARRRRVLQELTPRLLQLAQLARAQGIALTVDAEEAERLELSLDVFESVLQDESLRGWDGLGLAVQAFQKRALAVIEYLEQLARAQRHCIPVRLVKGAYWDSEIKRAQEQGLADYPVYTRKLNTDVAYLACARKLLDARPHFYVMLATHNAQTIAAVQAMAGDASHWEYQRLHGMGEALHALVQDQLQLPCRVYAPVGAHADLLPYLVRRLLENGANTSFVNRIFDEQLPPEQLAADPVAACAALEDKRNPQLPLPVALYGPSRRNSCGLSFADEPGLLQLAEELRGSLPLARAEPLLAQNSAESAWQAVRNPADTRQLLGHWRATAPEDLPAALQAAREAQPAWNARGVRARAALLEQAADALASARAEFLVLLVREAGKTLPDALAEWREAVDLLRYYASQAHTLMAAPQTLPGPTGEHNELQLHGRGVFVCISPWNFPLAIFSGQIAAALVTGNCVLAKSAEQTSLIAARMVQLLHACGLPRAVLQLLPGDGALGAALCALPQLAGVAFTGSLPVARSIARSLAGGEQALPVLIAETGGQNAMIVDSSALPEQVVKDALQSAFYSAGQRCSCLRILYLQEEIYERTVQMLIGAMQELGIGDPALLASDLGPLIDAPAQAALNAYAAQLRAERRVLAELSLPPETGAGYFFAPLLAQVRDIAQIGEERFGPILHVCSYRAKELDAVIDSLNASGYGLTLGVHSRIESTWRRVQQRARVGNCYVNRGMTGAVVGTQPFGGEGLSGTGPKAGGPHYLLRFVSERTLTVNTAAVGGNARLLAQAD
ncbi:L-proline dehydrogenase /delta-1-pyrroline-5-carboxylate dehydrogenase [Solimonas aquatica]|uniref:Bifunctional protein PutA n=1 Tax=Solimonas aquatica TaxID=489703 RepID=A0A1H9LW88_9GAMM|nr:bifunctional proline dehydrogenase/L-glutamate gamma-semialdehyde dehydrogenase PutA [Solimonas aquatica]SER15732.1 L-proline dehydrogenase /delta-1-pyrroline-5-carboxylate dehydrogenase [Solimonas aquatica]